MGNNQLPAKRAEQGLVKMPKDYPFIHDVNHHFELRKQTNRETQYTVAGKERIIIERSWYTVNGFAQLHRDQKEMLSGLSSSACKVFMYIALHLELGQCKVKIVSKDIALSDKTLAKALLELTHSRVIRRMNGSRDMWWVNVAIVLVGTTTKDSISEEG